MDNRHLRSILLNLQYRLSDNDREQLHFYLKNDVPRSIGDDSTLRGTLKLMQSLFDQDKINETDFTLLIDAFKQIRCYDAVQLLKGHQRRTLLSGLNQSTQSLTSMMPSLIEELMDDYEDDKLCMENTYLLNEMNYINNNNNNNNISGNNEITVNQDTQRISYSQKQWSCMSSLRNRYFLWIFTLFILTSVILIVVLIKGNNRINDLKNNLRIKESFIALAQNESNQTVKQSNKLLLEQRERTEQLNKTIAELNKQNNQVIKQWNDQLMEKNEGIEDLNKTLTEWKNERKTLLIKAGQKFGGVGGGDFDDSILPMFTSAHYLSGVVFSDINRFWACQFIYTSSEHNKSGIESNVHGSGGRTMHSTYKYDLIDDERIEKIQVRSVYAGPSFDSVSADPSRKPGRRTKLIVGLKFITTKGRSIPPKINLGVNDVESEHFPGYTLGYATGRSGESIDQLQFFWYQRQT